VGIPNGTKKRDLGHRGERHAKKGGTRTVLIGEKTSDGKQGGITGTGGKKGEPIKIPTGDSELNYDQRDEQSSEMKKNHSPN